MKKKTTFEKLIKQIKIDKRKKFKQALIDSTKHLNPKFRSCGSRPNKKKVVKLILENIIEDK